MIRAEIAKEYVKGEIKVLRMRSNNNQERVITYDAQMELEFTKRASGRTLEIIQNIWRSEKRKRSHLIGGSAQKNGYWIMKKTIAMIL